MFALAGRPLTPTRAAATIIVLSPPGERLRLSRGSPVMATISYFKRFRMEIDLNDLPPPEALPQGYTWIAWDQSLVDAHADVKAQCFADEVDAVVFPSLSNRDGCYYL